MILTPAKRPDIEINILEYLIMCYVWEKELMRKEAIKLMQEQGVEVQAVNGVAQVVELGVAHGVEIAEDHPLGFAVARQRRRGAVVVGDKWRFLEGYNVVPASAGRIQAYVTFTETAITMLFPSKAETKEEAEAEFTDEAADLLSRRTKDA